nr:pyridoxine-5'-phosphate oxidase-like isoform X5 [Parasteatoda tepidariorum]
MAIATATKSGKPSVRYLLLKSYGEDGFSFFSNYESRKGKEIAENPQVALLFYWNTLCRQIRIEGTVVKLSEKESEDYFHQRPRSSQLSALASRQSEVIESKDVVERKKEELENKYPEGTSKLPKPDYWGGYKVIPESFEFWCGRNDRFHDRMRFRKLSDKEKADEKLIHTGENGWIYEYLSP